MQTAIHTTVSYQPKESVISRFINWSTNQEKDRLFWTGLALTLQGCVLAPISLAAVAFASNWFVLWIVPLVCLVANLIVNLAALPTKITVPVFFLTLLLNVAVVIAALL